MAEACAAKWKVLPPDTDSLPARKLLVRHPSLATTCNRLPEESEEDESEEKIVRRKEMMVHRGGGFIRIRI